MIYIVAGKFKKQKLVTPRGMTTRPTLGKVRETLFNICQNEIEDASFLDLFAGTGAIGFEALSRGAKRVTFIENDKAAQKAIETNINHLGVDSEASLIRGDVFRSLEYLMPFDLIFADPPYGKGYGARILKLVEKYDLLRGSLFIEESEELTSDAFQRLSCRKMGRTFLSHFVRA